MLKEIKNIIPKKFKDFNILNIKSEASTRKYYRLVKDKQKVILMDSSNEPEQFENFIKVHKNFMKFDKNCYKYFYVFF